MTKNPCCLYAEERKAYKTRTRRYSLGVANGLGIKRVTRLSYLKMDPTTSNIVQLTMLGVVVSMLAVVCKRMQQLPILLRQQCWDLLCPCWQWCANGRNNSQYCCANNVGSCCVHVGSGVQTDATTPNIVAPTMLGVVVSMLAVVCKRMQQLPAMFRPAVHHGKDTTHKTLYTPRRNA